MDAGVGRVECMHDLAGRALLLTEVNWVGRDWSQGATATHRSENMFLMRLSTMGGSCWVGRGGAVEWGGG